MLCLQLSTAQSQESFEYSTKQRDKIQIMKVDRKKLFVRGYVANIRNRTKPVTTSKKFMKVVGSWKG